MCNIVLKTPNDKLTHHHVCVNHDIIMHSPGVWIHVYTTAVCLLKLRPFSQYIPPWNVLGKTNIWYSFRAGSAYLSRFLICVPYCLLWSPMPGEFEWMPLKSSTPLKPSTQTHSQIFKWHIQICICQAKVTQKHLWKCKSQGLQLLTKQNYSYQQ
jgi:hypothetical protein